MRNLLVPILFFFVAGCTMCQPTPQPKPPPAPTADASPPPPAPTPSPPKPVDSGTPSACSRVCSRLSQLRCPEWSPTCVADCESLDAKLAALHSPGIDHSCVITAPSCSVAKACR